jgi:putative ABC transport system permease protein
VQSAVSLFINLPDSYEAKIETVPGVAKAIRFQWFGGIYQDPSNFFGQFAVDAADWLESYPEVEIVDGSLQDWQATRTSCVIGQDLANRFGWRIGDKAPLLGSIFPMRDGSAWEFTVAGIYRSSASYVDQATMFFHFDYLYEVLEQGLTTGPRGVGVFLAQLQPTANPDAVIADIEGLFANGPQRVRATTEAEFTRQFVSMLGSVPTLLLSIGGGVLFAIFFAVLNTMLMAARERTRDIGILKALGFADGRIAAMLPVESLLICLVGGAIGVGLAVLAEQPLWSMMCQFGIPGVQMAGGVIAQGLLLAAAVGLLAGVLPALRARRMRPVIALREEV